MIKNVLFDLGGVLLNIDVLRTFAAFEALGFQHTEELFSQKAVRQLFLDLETGSIAPEAFYFELGRAAPEPVSEAALQTAWNSMLLSYRKASIQFLKPLAARYRLYLLSNTNAIHQAAFSSMLKEEMGTDSLDAFFIRAFYSHQIGLRKPEIEIYEFVLNAAGINASETLFIDDTEANLPNAEKLGIHTHLLLPNERIEHLEVWH